MDTPEEVARAEELLKLLLYVKNNNKAKLHELIYLKPSKEMNGIISFLKKPKKKYTPLFNEYVNNSELFPFTLFALQESKLTYLDELIYIFGTPKWTGMSYIKTVIHHDIDTFKKILKSIKKYVFANDHPYIIAGYAAMLDWNTYNEYLKLALSHVKATKDECIKISKTFFNMDGLGKKVAKLIYNEEEEAKNCYSYYINF
jgi:hypothetical protein